MTSENKFGTRKATVAFLPSVALNILAPIRTALPGLAAILLFFPLRFALRELSSKLVWCSSDEPPDELRANIISIARLFGLNVRNLAIRSIMGGAGVLATNLATFCTADDEPAAASPLDFFVGLGLFELLFDDEPDLVLPLLVLVPLPFGPGILPLLTVLLPNRRDAIDVLDLRF